MTPPPIMLTSFCGILVSVRTGIVHLGLLCSPSSGRSDRTRHKVQDQQIDAMCWGRKDDG